MTGVSKAMVAITIRNRDHQKGVGKMRSKQSIYKRFSFKLCLNALSICFISLMVLPIHAEEIPADIHVAVEKELLSKIEIKKSEMDDEALQVFRAQIYRVRPKLGYIAVVDGEVLDLNKSGTESTLPGYLKLIKDDFVLDSEEKASQLANAFHKAFPYKFKKIVKPVKVNHGWVVPLGKFFKKYSGLVFTTDEEGKITLVEFVLSIDPKDYSYKFNKQKRDIEQERIKEVRKVKEMRIQAEQEKIKQQEGFQDEEPTESDKLRSADKVDSDRDGVSNRYDVCLTVKNPNQEDTDNDRVGDACDSCPEDPAPRYENGCPLGVELKN